MKKAWIITAAPASNVEFYKSLEILNDDVVICADGGFDNAALFGIKPNIVVGDMDSIKGAVPQEVEVIVFPVKKDKTDTEIAIDYAIGRGIEEIVIIGEMVGKLSHTLANIYLLKYIDDKGARGELISSKERIVLIKRGKSRIFGNRGKEFSLIPANDCRGLSIYNAEYELERMNVKIGSTLCINNKFIGEETKISLEYGEMIAVVEN